MYIRYCWRYIQYYSIIIIIYTTAKGTVHVVIKLIIQYNYNNATAEVYDRQYVIIILLLKVQFYYKYDTKVWFMITLLTVWWLQFSTNCCFCISPFSWCRWWCRWHQYQDTGTRYWHASDLERKRSSLSISESRRSLLTHPITLSIHFSLLFLSRSLIEFVPYYQRWKWETIFMLVSWL